MKKRLTEEQIIQVLKEHEAGIKTSELCRKARLPHDDFRPINITV
jgi:hypothetical protein